jgi:hypothetical protein
VKRISRSLGAGQHRHKASAPQKLCTQGLAPHGQQNQGEHQAVLVAAGRAKAAVVTNTRRPSRCDGTLPSLDGTQPSLDGIACNCTYQLVGVPRPEPLLTAGRCCGKPYSSYIPSSTHKTSLSTTQPCHRTPGDNAQTTLEGLRMPGPAQKAQRHARPPEGSRHNTSC